MGISPVVIHIENIFHTDDILSLIKLSPSLFPNQEDTICKKSFLSQAVKLGRKKDEAWTAPLVQCFFSSIISDFFFETLQTQVIYMHNTFAWSNKSGKQWKFDKLWGWEGKGVSQDNETEWCDSVKIRWIAL